MGQVASQTKSSSEFYNRSMQSGLEYNFMKMYSTHNEEIYLFLKDLLEP